MAEDYYSHYITESSRAMESLNIQGSMEMGAAALSSLFVPDEIIVDILENLVPAHNLFNPVYLGARVLDPILEGLDTLRAFCLVSRRMNTIATQFLYRVIFIADSYSLTCLHETLEEDSAHESPVLCGYIESLVVYQHIVPAQTGPADCISLDSFSSMIVSILQKSPRLAKFSLVPIGSEVFQNSTSRGLCSYSNQLYRAEN